MFPISGAMLALTGALAAACFVKAFGITFLAQPRSEHARHRRTKRRSPCCWARASSRRRACSSDCSRPLFLKLLDPVTQQLTGQQISAQLTAGQRAGALVRRAPERGTVSTLGIALMGLCLLPVPLVLWLAFGARAKTRIGPTWDCGQHGLTPQMEYTATGFSKPIRMIFKALFRPRREVQREYDFSPYFATTHPF